MVYVVRDQLSQINSFYAQQVKMLENVEAFGPHAAGVLRRGDADLELQTARWYDSADFDFVAVPFPALSQPNPLVTLLRAARIVVPEADLAIGPEVVNITLGPVAVEAIRLLRTYLQGLNRSMTDDDPAVRRLHRIAASSGRKIAGWCDEPYTGMARPLLPPERREQLAPSNERFASEVWGSAWPMPLPVEGAPARAQLLALPPDELDTVHEFVIAMAKRYATLRSGPIKVLILPPVGSGGWSSRHRRDRRTGRGGWSRSKSADGRVEIGGIGSKSADGQVEIGGWSGRNRRWSGRNGDGRGG